MKSKTFVGTLVVFLLFVSMGLSASQRDTSSSAREWSLRHALQGLNLGESSKYVVAFRDLNGDNKVEAIVYLMGVDWCGSGGCNTLVLTPRNNSWVVISKISITRPPIKVLTKTSHGWHSLSVLVHGGGIQREFCVELDFNGVSYPSNPTVLPAFRLEKLMGEVVIPSTKDAQYIY